MRILYVEDNEANQALVGRVARIKSHSIVYRDEGEGALELLSADTEIDLILLDIELAGSISGLDVVKTLRGRDDHRPIVAVTAYAMMGDRERILAAGCDQYLPKPLVITDLLALMEHYETGQPLPASMEAAAEQLSAPVAAAPETPAAPAVTAPVDAAPDAPVTAIHSPETPAAAAPEIPAAAAPGAPVEPVNAAPVVEQKPEEKPVVVSVPVQADPLSVVSEIQSTQPKSSDGDISV